MDFRHPSQLVPRPSPPHPFCCSFSPPFFFLPFATEFVPPISFSSSGLRQRSLPLFGPPLFVLKRPPPLFPPFFLCGNRKLPGLFLRGTFVACFSQAFPPPPVFLQLVLGAFPLQFFLESPPNKVSRSSSFCLNLFLLNH